jgi:hypothetical protein
MEIVGLRAVDFESALRERAQAESAYDARVARLLLDLVEGLRREAMGPRLFASYHVDRDLWLQYRSANGAYCMVTVAMDRPDYGAIENGLPRFHYRMTYRITAGDGRGQDAAVEERCRSVESAVEFVSEAISETRKFP